jgi:ribosome-associated protein
MIRVTPSITIPEKELKEEFIHAAGPGGQNVNKVATAVQLRFDIRNSPSLPEDVRGRLLSLAGKRVTDDGVLIIKANRFRSQDRNRQDAVHRLIELIRRASKPPRKRRKTRPTMASVRRRLSQKQHRSAIKEKRGSVSIEQDE